jgi:uncharacterized membrane protein
MAIIATKEDEELHNSSVDDLRKMLEELNDWLMVGVAVNIIWLPHQFYFQNIQKISWQMEIIVI